MKFYNNEEILIEADRNRLCQFVFNLFKISNNDKIIVSIKDTGSGKDPEILPKLFTKFATKSTSEADKGFGLIYF